MKWAWLASASISLTLLGCGGGGTDDPKELASATDSAREAPSDVVLADDGPKDTVAGRFTLVNGSFEKGSYSGWTPKIAWGVSEFEPHDRPAGTVTLIDSRNNDFPRPTRWAKDGRYFLRIGTGNEWFVGELSYDITVSQVVRLRKGDTLKGFAYYYNGDYVAQDSFWVKILDPTSKKLLATPWIEYSGGEHPEDPNSVPYRSITKWTPWQWTAPRAGLYTLQLGATTAGDNLFDSYGFFDAIALVPAERVDAVANVAKERSAELSHWRPVMKHPLP